MRSNMTAGALCLISAAAFAATQLSIWRSYGASFQLGYVVGYLEAIQLSQRKDQRVMIPVARGRTFDRWIRDVNAFFEDPANVKRSVPDAMHAVGIKIREEWMQEFARKAKPRASLPSPSPGP